MSANNDTPLKRLIAATIVLGAFLLFGIITLTLAPLSKTSGVTAADQDGATRRMEVRELVDTEQAQYLIRAEKGEKMQVPPTEVFSLVGAKLVSGQPTPFQNEQFRDPNQVTEEATATPAESSEKVEAPAANEAAPAANEATPAVKEEAPIVKEVVPTAKEQASIAKQESPVKKEESVPVEGNSVPHAPRPETNF